MILTALRALDHHQMLATLSEENNTVNRRLTLYHPSKFRNRLPFELQCSATTHFKGFV